jgi:hypothetical protein
MSDPLSISAGVAGLVSLAIGLSQVSYSYIKAFKGFSKAWSSYIRELSALTSILVQAQQAIEVGGVGHLLVARTPDIPGDIINECRIELESLKQKLSKTGIKKSIEALKWPFTESETQKTVEMLYRFNSIFSLALSVDNLYVCGSSIYFLSAKSWKRCLGSKLSRDPRSERRQTPSSMNIYKLSLVLTGFKTLSQKSFWTGSDLNLILNHSNRLVSSSVRVRDYTS